MRKPSPSTTPKPPLQDPFQTLKDQISKAFMMYDSGAKGFLNKEELRYFLDEVRESIG
jgi:Ca2+-binding EF-hand superfamily protein